MQYATVSKKDIPVIARDNTAFDLHFLDTLRGIAAAVVMVGHARWLLWEGYSEGFVKHPDQYSLPARALVYLLSMFRYGHQSVLFFFVLSGFVIHLRYSKNLAKNTLSGFDWWPFLLRRIRRIYPPFVFALLLTFILDTLGSNLGYSIYRAQTPVALLNVNITTHHDLINLFGNLIFWQNEHIGTWGTNTPMWSLKFEWWFYMIYPLLFFVNKRSAYISGIVVLAAFLLAYALHFVSSLFIVSIFQYLLAWWLGAVLADQYTRRLPFKYSHMSIAALLIPVMVITEARIQQPMVADILWAVGFFGLLNFLFYLKTRGYQFMLLQKLKWLGDCSYTLYIIHFPVLVFFNGVILHYTGNVMPQTQLFIIAAIVLMPAMAYVIHLLVEKPFLSKKNHYRQTAAV